MFITTYNAANNAVKVKSLLSNFNYFSSYSGVRFLVERVEVHSPTEITFLNMRRSLKPYAYAETLIYEKPVTVG